MVKTTAPWNRSLPLRAGKWPPFGQIGVIWAWTPVLWTFWDDVWCWPNAPLSHAHWFCRLKNITHRFLLLFESALFVHLSGLDCPVFRWSNKNFWFRGHNSKKSLARFSRYCYQCFKKVLLFTIINDHHLWMRLLCGLGITKVISFTT